MWLFSRDTLRLVQEIYEDIEDASEIERHLPHWLKATLFSLSIWRLCIVLISIPLILLLGPLVIRFLKPLLTILLGRLLEDTQIDQMQGLVAPLRLMLFGI
ncbi:MAG: hypothetical protein JOZ29_13375 [Deltaproteobacteria bacterium]|nr:hypothetical protein [Deltaproteobacteria bacterium]